MFDDDISPEMREMVENMERKKKINSERLMELLQRIHRIDQICKKVRIFLVEIDFFIADN